MTIYDQIQNEVTFWGSLKHDNVCKAFIWFEHEDTDGHDKMYLMLQYADLGTICDDKNKANPKVVEFLTRKLTEEDEFSSYGADTCESMRERLARFIFS